MTPAAPPEPAWLPIRHEAIPGYVKRIPQWVGWRSELLQDKKTKVSRWTKPPHRVADPKRKASDTNPATWGTFADALDAYSTGALTGIGLVLTDEMPVTGIDLDHCRDIETGMINPWAHTITTRMNSYTESSPSGKGLRILVFGYLPGPRCRKGHIELYDHARYLTMTGHHVDGTPPLIMARLAELHELYEEVFAEAPRQDHPSPAIDRDDQIILDRAMRARDGDKFRRLWSGDASGYGSSSEADLALCALLAFWTGNDPARMDALFRQSGLMRGKWNEKRGRLTYGEKTIATASASGHEVYTPTTASPNGHHRVTVEDDPLPDEAPPEATRLEFPEAGMVGLGRDFADLYSQHIESPRSFLYMSFLTYFGSLISRMVTLESELWVQPRLFAVNLGQSANTRKSTALRKADEFFAGLGTFAPHVLYGVGSAEGLAAEMEVTENGGGPVLLLHLDELRTFVDKARTENSILLPMTGSLFERNDYDNRVKAKKVSVRGGYLAMLAACTVETSATMFAPAFFDIGFLNRLFITIDESPARFALPAKIDGRELTTLRDRVMARLTDIDRMYAAYGARPVPLPVAPEALAMFEAWYLARGRSVFERRLDTYGHRLMVLLAATSGKTTVPWHRVRPHAAGPGLEGKARGLVRPACTLELDEEVGSPAPRAARGGGPARATQGARPRDRGEGEQELQGGRGARLGAPPAVGRDGGGPLLPVGQGPKDVTDQR